MRPLLILAALFLMNLASQHASATPQQCERSVRQSDIAGIETHCAHLKNSQNAGARKSYYSLLGLAYGRKFKFDDGSFDPFLAKAIDNLSQAIAIADRGKRTREDADLYYMRGIFYLQNKPPGQVISPDASKALKDFSVAISLKPNDGSYHLARGYAHNQLLNPNAAWADFQKAKTLNPSDPDIRDAWEKQRRITPEGQAEMTKKLDEVTKAPSGKFTCTATIRDLRKEPDGATTILVTLKAGCGIEPISLTSSPPPECVVGAKVTATGTLITEELLFLEVQRLVDVTQISCK
jgi:tetratricopeptide (TPR) repeat protein